MDKRGISMNAFELSIRGQEEYCDMSMTGAPSFFAIGGSLGQTM